MKIFGTPLSPFVRKVLIVAHLKGITIEFKMVTPHAEDEAFKAASPFGLVPAIDDDGFLLSDSSAIALYLERRYPTPPLLPGDAKAYGRALWLEEFGDSILGKACGNLAFQTAFAPRLFNRAVDEALVKKYSEEDVPAALTYLESVIPGCGFLTGDDFSLADASVIAALMALTLASYTVEDKQWPKVTSYMKRALEHPAVAGEFERMIQTAKIVGIF